MAATDGVATSSNCGLLVSGGDEGSLRAWDGCSWACLRTCKRKGEAEVSALVGMCRCGVEGGGARRGGGRRV